MTSTPSSTRSLTASASASRRPTLRGVSPDTEILDVTPSTTKSDRGIVYVETRGRNQDEAVVLTLRRRVLIPRRPEPPSP